jgi:hypothetical protein
MPPCVNLKMVDARGLPGIILGKMNIKNSATENVNTIMPNLFNAYAIKGFTFIFATISSPLLINSYNSEFKLLCNKDRFNLSKDC